MPRILGSQSHSFLGNAGRESLTNSYASTPTLPLTATPQHQESPPQRRGMLSSSSFNRSVVRTNSVDTPPSAPRRTPYRAAERGRGELLPTTSTSSNDRAPNRVHSMSSGLIKSAVNAGSRWNAQPPSRELRSRGRRNQSNGSCPVDEASVASNISQYSHSDRLRKQSWRNHPLFQGWTSNWIQTIILLGIMALVWETQYRSTVTSEQFEKLKHDESLIMLHLQGLERKSMQLHEVLGRLSDGAIANPGRAANNKGDDKDNEPVDAKLIHVQTQQLYQMEEELQHELKGLQTKLQQVARSSIVRMFGEGPVQVTLDIQFGDKGTEQIAISLWYDTPHAAWTLIDQVQSGRWIGSSFSLASNGASITATPPAPTATTIDFVEQGTEKHEAWTVGLAEDDGGGLSLFINLQDNSADKKYDVCVGKVVEGFGSLQKLVSSLRSNKPVSVAGATASRIAHKKAAGLFE